MADIGAGQAWSLRENRVHAKCTLKSVSVGYAGSQLKSPVKSPPSKPIS